MHQEDEAAMAETTEDVELENPKLNGASQEKRKVKFDSAMPRDEAVSYFEAILAGLKQGKLHFKQGEKTLVVSPADHLAVEVKAARKGQREKVPFELSWELSDGESLEISPGE
jgi:amphi-Trp domain-containing protein